MKFSESTVKFYFLGKTLKKCIFGLFFPKEDGGSPVFEVRGIPPWPKLPKWQGGGGSACATILRLRALLYLRASH